MGSYKGQSAEEVSELFDGLKNGTWPGPDKVAYFDPSGGSANVIRYAKWSPKKVPIIGVVVHFNGRTEFIEKNIYTYKELLDRGYEVWSMDWRGQGLSARSDPSLNKQKHHIDDFQTYVNDADYFIHKVVKLPASAGKKVLLAHSMGGQIALRYLIIHKKIFDYAVLSSPLLRIPGDNGWLRTGNRIKALLFPTSCVITKKDEWESDFQVTNICALASSGKAEIHQLVDDKDDENAPKPALAYSNDLSKLADINCMISQSIDARGANEPDFRLACPTSKWLQAALSSTDVVMEKGSEIETPILIIRATNDKAVDPQGQTEFYHKYQDKCELVNLDKIEAEDVIVGHELLIEIPAVAERFFTEFDRFTSN